MFLAHKGVEVEVKNVRKDLQEMQQMVRMGSQATPTTGRAGELIIGLDLKRISARRLWQRPLRRPCEVPFGHRLAELY